MDKILHLLPSFKKNIMKSKKLETVFIVEDSEIERSMLKDHLSKYKNLKIKEYSSGSACVKDLIVGNAQEPDLILMDYFLDSNVSTSKDGLESLAKLKEVCPGTNVIMLTSVDNKRIIELAKEKGALDYIVKGSTGFEDLDSVLKKHFTVEN
jgi:DNA-binding NarL/FixJ family response regulator